MASTYLITGGCGFIGSNFILRLLRQREDANVINLDKLTYAGNQDNLRDIAGDPRYRFVQGDITDAALVGELMEGADRVVNFAAETHVDRSLIEPGAFIQTDVFGTYVLLEAARQARVERFLHMSTDEVYGDVPEGQTSHEADALNPRSPYAASKAGAEMQCRAYIETYGLPVVIARPANNVGPRQHVEKLVPLFTTNALQDQPLPVYGDGRQQRDWLFVEDSCATSRTAPATTAGTPSTPTSCAPSAGRPATTRRRASRRRLSGTCRTAGGGRRCATRASRSTTTSSMASASPRRSRSVPTDR